MSNNINWLDYYNHYELVLPKNMSNNEYPLESFSSNYYNKINDNKNILKQNEKKDNKNIVKNKNSGKELEDKTK